MCPQIVSAKRPRRLPPLYDPEVSNGCIVGVRGPADGLTAGMTTAREAAGEGRVKTAGWEICAERVWAATDFNE